MSATILTAALATLIPLLVLVTPLLLDSLERTLLVAPPAADDADQDR